MGRDTIYRYEWTNDLGHQLRLDILPAHTAALPGSPTIKTIPDGLFIDSISGQVKFRNGLMIGTTEPEKLTVNLNLKASTGDTELDDLREYLVNPEVEVTFDAIGNGYVKAPVKVSNVWTIYSDEGAGITPAVIIFQGVQRRKPGGISIDVEKNESMMMETELVHIATAVYGLVKPVDVVNHVYSIYQAAEPSIRTGFTFCHTEIYKDVTTYTFTNGAVEMSLGFIRFGTVYYAVSTAATNVYRKFMRTISANAKIISEFTSTTNVATNAHPFEHWNFFGHSYLTDGLANTTAAISEIYVLATIEIDSSFVGGIMDDQKDIDKTLYRWKTMLEFLQDTAESAVSKGIFSVQFVSGTWSIVLKYYRPLEAIDEVSLTIDDFSEKPTINIGYERVSSAKCAIAGGYGSDQSDIGYDNIWSTDNENDFAVPATFHNCPTVWKNGDAVYRIENLSLVSTDDLSCISKNINPFTLWYYTYAPHSGGNLLVNQRMVRLHQYCQMNDGYGTTWEPSNSSTGLPHPNPDDIDIGNSQDGDTHFGSPYRLTALSQQLMSGIPYVASNAIATRFGKDRQTMYKGSFTIDQIKSSQIGCKIASIAFTDGADFFGDASLGSLPGGPYITSVQYDLITGKCEVEMVGIAS